MIEEPCCPGRLKIPWGFLGMLVFVGIGERYVARHELRFTNPTAQAWKSSGRAARLQAPRCEILCFGDSIIKFGILPRVLEDRLGKKAFNLAVFCGPPPADFFLLRRALDSGAKPAALLVDFQPFHIYNGDGGPRYLTRSWPEMTSLRDCLDLVSRTRDADLFASIMLGRLLPSAKSRHEIRSNVLAALGGQAVGTEDSILVLKRHLNVNKGAMVGPMSPHSPEKTDDFALSLYPQNYGDATRADRVTMAYIRGFLRLAAEREIPVFLLLPPMNSGIQARFEASGLDAIQTRFARGVVARYPNLVVIDGRRARYDHTLFCDDKVHLNGRGAFAFSSDVAAICRDYLARPATSPRWFDLPTFRDHPIDVAVEDYDQSRIALDASRARR